MANLSITTAWNEAVAFVKREAQLLFPLAFLLMSLPAAILQASIPAPASPQDSPEPGLWLLLLPIVIVLSITGSLAINILALRQNMSGGEAIRHGLRRAPAAIGAALLLALAYILALIPLVLVTGSAAAAGQAEMSATQALLILVYAVIALLIGVRFVLMTPVAAAEPVGPIAIIRRSWQLTSGHYWKLLGFLLLLVALFMIVSVAVTAILGILVFSLGGPPEPGSVSSFVMLLIGAVLNCVFAVYFASMYARIYAQLAPGAATQ